MNVRRAGGGLGVAAAVAIAAAACGAKPSGDAGACSGYDAIVAASDYASSGVGAFSLDGRGKLVFGVDLGSDPALAVSRGRAFYVARMEDRVFELDRCGTPIGRVSTNDPSRRGTTNPQDVAVAPDGALWVPRYDLPSIAVLEPSGALRASIDLAPYDDDGNPNASAIRIVDVEGAAKAFVTLERLDDTQSPPRPKRPARLLRVDVSTMRVDATIDLAGTNPFGLFEHGGAFYLAEPGDFSAADEPLAGVERVDPQRGATALVARERDLGGSVAEVAVTDGCAAAIVADPTTKNATSLVTFDPNDGRVLRAASDALLRTDGFDLQGLAWVKGALVVGDRRRVDRGYPVHVFDRGDGCALTPRGDVVFLQQKPVAIRVVE